MEGEAEQSFFAAGRIDLVGNIQKRGTRSDSRIIWKDSDQAILLNNKNPVRSVVRVRQEYWLRKGQAWECIDELNWLGQPTH